MIMFPRLLVTTVVVIVTTMVAHALTQDEPIVAVRETSGTYVVEARFGVAAPASVVREVLTDYASIPRFMPGVRTSEVLQRDEGYARVEQEAVSKFMMFSKRVHLVLDVDEGGEVIRFRDRCKKSFEKYEGAWRISERDGRTVIAYELSAQPAFSVPDFVLRKLLNRDARAMIDRLRMEIEARVMSRQS
jgi:ribosome-associated toxin RatA of RatAB toxin-antitoxin module